VFCFLRKGEQEQDPVRSSEICGLYRIDAMGIRSSSGWSQEGYMEHEPAESRTDSRSSLFPLVLHPTYYNQGLFNVTVEFDHFVRRTDGSVAILLGPERRRIEGRVDRKVNNNGTARVLGGRELRDWFQRQCREGQTVYVDLSSPASMAVNLQAPSSGTISA
jgi:hypothetical protein